MMNKESTYIGVRELRDRVRKQDLLLFDEIAIPELSPQLGRVKDPKKRAELEWLLDRGVVSSFRLPDEPLERGAEAELMLIILGLQALQTVFQGSNQSTGILSDLANRGFFVAVTRLAARHVERERQVRTVPLLPYSPSPSEWNLTGQVVSARSELLNIRNSRGYKKLSKRKRRGIEELCANITRLMNAFLERQHSSETIVQSNGVVEITLQALPMPDDATPWEQVVEFCEDETTRHSRLQLRKWMRIVGTDSSPIEIKEQLQELIATYTDYMRLHRMKTQPGVLQTFVTVGASLAEQVVKRNWGEAAKTLFTLRNRKISLIEEARNAPGHEIAYIINARERFRHL